MPRGKPITKMTITELIIFCVLHLSFGMTAIYTSTLNQGVTQSTKVSWLPSFITEPIEVSWIDWLFFFVGMVFLYSSSRCIKQILDRRYKNKNN